MQDSERGSYDAEIDHIDARRRLLEARSWFSWFLPTVGALTVGEKFFLQPAARGAFLISGTLGSLLLFWLWHSALTSVRPVPPHPYAMDGTRSPLRWWLRVLIVAADMFARLVAAAAFATMVQFAPAVVVDTTRFVAEPTAILDLVAPQAPILAKLAVEVLKDTSVVAMLCAIVSYLSSRLASAAVRQFAAGGEPSNRELLIVVLVVVGISTPLAIVAVSYVIGVWDRPRYALHATAQSIGLIGAFVWLVTDYRTRWTKLRGR